ncbi:MAG: FAD-binding protein [Chloroflexi bacterium]|nr:FAD-binding protein [Chloroflexota bacterium]
MQTPTAEITKSLHAILPRESVVTNPVELLTYEIDGSLGIGHPSALVLPRDTNDVVAMVHWAIEHGVPLVPRGAGTGLSGGALAGDGGIVMSFARMKKVVELDEVGRTAIAQPGIVHQTFDEFVKTKGLYYPPDPASGRSCTLGGNWAENAGGPHCFKYGVTTNYVTGAKVVLADGRVVITGGRALDYPEYDLTGIFVGSEGTLGVMTEMYVRLIRNIPGVKTMMATFDSVEEAGDAVSAVIARGLVPATLEMMDKNMIGIVENFVHAGLPTEANALLIIEADGFPASLDSQMNEFSQVLRANRARELRLAKTAAERDQIWYARKSAFGAIAQISPAFLMVDGTVPRSKLGKTLGAINDICAEQELRVGYVFHAGDGNLHPLIMFDPRNPEMVQRMHIAGQQVMELCVRQGGTITGEHGVGSEKIKYMPLMFSPEELQAQQEIKDIFDPRHLLNPNKIIPGIKDLSGLRDLTGLSAPITGEFAPSSIEEISDAFRAWNAMNTAPSVTIRASTNPLPIPPPPKTGEGAIVLDTRGLRGVKAYARDDLYVTVGAGTTLAELQTELARDQVWAPIASPWNEATIGGIVATNYNAPLRMRYGALRDLILTVTNVLPDGRIIHAGKPVVKNVAGYDLVKLFIGAHGTLGVMTEVTFKLMPFPRARKTLVVPVDDLNRGTKLGMRLLRVCLVASSLLLCKGCDVPGTSSPYAMVYTAEGLPEDVDAELDEARQVIAAEGFTATQDESLSGTDLWGNWINASSREGTLVRAGVPAKDLASVVAKLDATRAMVDFGNGLIYAHNASLAGLRQAARAVGGYAVVLSGASNDVWGHQPDLLDVMRALKNKWDPRGLCNPGAFIV